MLYVSVWSRGTNGEAMRLATIAIAIRYAVAGSERRPRPLPLGRGAGRSPEAISEGTAVTPCSPSVARAACGFSPGPGREPQRKGGSVSQVKVGLDARLPPSE